MAVLIHGQASVMTFSGHLSEANADEIDILISYSAVNLSTSTWHVQQSELWGKVAAFGRLSASIKKTTCFLFG